MSYPVEKSRRIVLNRDVFDFSDLDEVLEWVDFFSPSDAAFVIEKFENLTGKDFKQEYKHDFMRDYIPPSDDEPMREPVPEPSEDLRREILFYWDQLYHPRSSSRPFMLDQTPEGIDAWNKRHAPAAYALYQADMTDDQTPATTILADSQPTVCATASLGANILRNAVSEIGRGDCTKLTSAESTSIAISNAGVLAQKIIVDTLTIGSDSSDVPVTEESATAAEVNDAHKIREARSVYAKGLPCSPRRTRSISRLDKILALRPVAVDEGVIDLTERDLEVRRKFASDQKFTVVEFQGRVYAVRAPDIPTALRILGRFAE